MTDADLAVYEILDKTGGGVPLETIANMAGLSETQVRVSLKYLSQQHLIEPAGKKGRSLLWKTRGKNLTAPVGFRRAPTSDPAESPSNEDADQPESAWGADRVAADARKQVSAPDLPEPSPEEKQQWLAYADAFLDRLADLPAADLGPGKCGQCERDVRKRWTLGQFELCRDCRTSRRRVQMMLDLTDQQRRTLTDALAEAAKLRLADD